MDQPNLSDAQDIADLAKSIVPKIEERWGCIISLDLEILQEAAGRGLLTLDHVGLEKPNRLKQAGHFAFWIRKLKPLAVVNLSEFPDLIDELKGRELLGGDGRVTAGQDIVPPPRKRFVSEMLLFTTC